MLVFTIRGWRHRRRLFFGLALLAFVICFLCWIVTALRTTSIATGSAVEQPLAATAGSEENAAALHLQSLLEELTVGPE